MRVAVVALATVTLAAACSSSHRATPPPPSPTATRPVIPTASPTEECTSTAHVTRCTPLGELGAWDYPVVAPSGRSVTVSFLGFCGAAPGDYRAVSTETDDRVTIEVFGARPYSNLCAASKTLTVPLRQPLRSRRIIDGYDGRERHQTRGTTG